MQRLDAPAIALLSNVVGLKLANMAHYAHVATFCIGGAQQHTHAGNAKQQEARLDAALTLTAGGTVWTPSWRTWQSFRGQQRMLSWFSSTSTPKSGCSIFFCMSSYGLRLRPTEESLGRGACRCAKADLRGRIIWQLVPNCHGWLKLPADKGEATPISSRLLRHAEDGVSLARPHMPISGTSNYNS